MINSFWNICSTCPMPKEEKLNSEYKRNYVWHPQYKLLAQDVISCAPQPTVKEVGIQRRKQYPELAYRNNEVIRHDLGYYNRDATDLRARSEERDAAGLASKSGPRSRSAEPGSSHQHQKLIMVQSFPPITSGRVSMLPKSEEFPIISEKHSETTEYKSQFAWPKKTEEEIPCFARKSVSMNIIKSSDETDMCVPKSKATAVHRPCTKQKEAVIPEKIQEGKKKIKTEYKAKYKPFTSYVYADGQWKKTSRLFKVPEKQDEANEEPWFVEVVERLQKANEYRLRGHAGELLPENYKQLPQISSSRSKLVLPDLQPNVPKCHSVSKKSEAKRKETQVDSSREKKKEKEAKTPPALRRPKSAEPVKAKDTGKHKRPATTPPAKPSAHVLPTRRKLHTDEVEKKSKARTASLKKHKDDFTKVTASSSSKIENPPSSSQSSGGKVWLQADQPVSEPKGGDDLSVMVHTDAVRPSSLSPISKPLSQHEQSKKIYNDVEPKEVSSSSETKSTVPYCSVVPLTHVRTPEEVTGVKSPDPENWTVPIENSEKLQWSGTSTPDVPVKLKPSEEISEKLSKLPTDESVPSAAGLQESAPSSSKLTSANVLDRARSRLDQFWGKNK